MKLRQIWFVAEILGALNVVKNYKKNTADWMQIQTAKVWLKGVGIARELVIYQVGILACVMVLVFSAILMEIALLFCLPISPEAKAKIALAIGAIDFAIALGFLGHFLSAERWLRKASHYNEYLANTL